MATENWVNIGSGNGLLPKGTKQLPEPMLTYHQQGAVSFIWGQCYKRYLSQQLLKSDWKSLPFDDVIMWFAIPLPVKLLNIPLNLYRLSGRTSYPKISRCLETARFGFRLFQSFWNLTVISAWVSNFRAINHYIIQFNGFKTTQD